jgi:soluble lytic murein transglycosylase
MDLPVSRALALSIARRESEFNAGVGSPVGALGLMQLMPATAEEVAGTLDLPYSRARLTADWRYNATLGAQYLAYLEEEFGPSPVMIAAGYNAGPSRPKSWIAERGDPRLREMDVVDWIEHIPFRETLTYVQRVTESIPIYEARLSGQAGPINFSRLLTGEKPVLRPRARPDAGVSTDEAAAPEQTVPADSVEPTPAKVEVPRSLRPVARPGRG